MLLPLLAILVGLVLLVWSADRFVDGAASTASYFGMPPLLIGMVIVGFGTSAPEMVVSAFSALQGNPGLALGNAYGSNITNIALILGFTAVISPVLVRPQVLRRELPLLTLVTALSIWQLWDGVISRLEGCILLGVFFLVMGWSIWRGMRENKEIIHDRSEEDETAESPSSLGKSIFSLVIGFILLVVSSKILVWGAVEIAQKLGVSDIIIGLTIVALGTSLPELASSVIAARKGEDDIALGNIIGSNLFNTLAVVGIAGSIAPITAGQEVLYRDALVMSLLTVSLFIIGYSFRGKGIINRFEGAGLLVCYAGYTSYLIYSAFA